MLPGEGGATERNSMCALSALFAQLQDDGYDYQEEADAKEDKEWEEQDREADLVTSCN